LEFEAQIIVRIGLNAMEAVPLGAGTFHKCDEYMLQNSFCSSRRLMIECPHLSDIPFDNLNGINADGP
jgi:hypothetical protein